MARGKQFDHRGARRIQAMAQTPITEADMSRQWLQGGDCRLKLTPERAELILLKVASGMTAKAAALELGLAPGTVNSAAYNDPEGFGERLREARREGAPTLFETMIEVAFDPDEDPRRSKLKIDVLEKMAKVYDRAVFGDQVRVDAVHSIAPVILPEIAFPRLPTLSAPETSSDQDDDHSDGE